MPRRCDVRPSADAIRAAEALLFAGGEPITAKALGEKLGPAVDVAAVLMKLKADYAAYMEATLKAAGVIDDATANVILTLLGGAGLATVRAAVK